MMYIYIPVIEYRHGEFGRFTLWGWRVGGLAGWLGRLAQQHKRGSDKPVNLSTYLYQIQ